MAYGNYVSPYMSGGNGQYVQPYGNATYPQQYAMQSQQPVAQQPQMQQQAYVQPQQQMVYEMPIQAVKFVTEDEAKAYIVMPNQRVLLIDRINGIAYDKSADSLGQSKSKMYHFVDPNKTIETPAVPTIDLDKYATKEELDGFVTQDNLSSFKKEMIGKMDDLKKTVIEKYLNTETKPERQSTSSSCC